MSEPRMKSPVDALMAQIAEMRRARSEDVKAHQESLDAAVHDVQRLDRVLAMLQAEDEMEIDLSDGTDPRVRIVGGLDGRTYQVDLTGPPLSVPHTIDVGAVAAAVPRHNPFAERPESLPYAMWEVMQAGEAWHVMKDLQPALRTLTGLTYGESTIYNVLRREPTVFEGSGGFYRVTAAYRNAGAAHDA